MNEAEFSTIPALSPEEQHSDFSPDSDLDASLPQVSKNKQYLSATPRLHDIVDDLLHNEFNRSRASILSTLVLAWFYTLLGLPYVVLMLKYPLPHPTLLESKVWAVMLYFLQVGGCWMMYVVQAHSPHNPPTQPTPLTQHTPSALSYKPFPTQHPPTVSSRKYLRCSLLGRLRPHLAQIQTATVMLTMLLFCSRLIARIHRGSCAQDEVAYTWHCNPFARNHGLPMESLLMVLTSPFILCLVARETQMVVHLVSYLVSLSTMIYCGYYLHSGAMISLFVMYMVSSLLIIFNVRRQALTVFFMNQKLKEYIVESERHADEVHANEMRSMIANVAHDLKTPLTSLQNGVELIQQVVNDMRIHCSHTRTASAPVPGTPSPHAEEEDYVFTIAQCVSSMRHTHALMLMTINRCIDFTKASKGLRLMPHCETLSLAETIALPVQCVQELADSSQRGARNHIHVSELSEEICSHVNTDKQWLQENLLCLLSNAVKYSSGGDVRLSVHLVPAHNPPSRQPSRAFGKLNGMSTSSGMVSSAAMQRMKSLVSRSLSSHGHHNNHNKVLPVSSAAQPEAQQSQQTQQSTHVHRGGALSHSQRSTSTHLISYSQRSHSTQHTHNTQSTYNTQHKFTFSGSLSVPHSPHNSQSHQFRSRRPSRTTSTNRPRTTSQESVSVSERQSGPVPAIPVHTDTNTDAPPTHMLRFEVEDHGVGLHSHTPHMLSERGMGMGSRDHEILIESERERLSHALFSPLIKQAPRSAGAGGAGLGLYALSKRVEALAGRCGVEGRRDGAQGSLFWFEIPYRPDKAAAARIYEWICPPHTTQHTCAIPTHPEVHMRTPSHSQTLTVTQPQTQREEIESESDFSHSHTRRVLSLSEGEGEGELEGGTSHSAWALSDCEGSVCLAGPVCTTQPKADGREHSNHGSENEGDQPHNILSQKSGAFPPVLSVRIPTPHSPENTFGLQSHDGKLIQEESTTALSRPNTQQRMLPAPTTGPPPLLFLPSTHTSPTNALTQTQTQTPHTPHSSRHNNISPLHILVVDDSLAILKTMKMLLTRQGHAVETAEHGAQCVERVCARRVRGDRDFDVVLMDLQMPVVDGLQATRTLRCMERRRRMHGLERGREEDGLADECVIQCECGLCESLGVFRSENDIFSKELCVERHDSSPSQSNSHQNARKDLLIVGVSASSDEDAKRCALAAGQDAFLAKPFTMLSFYETLQRLMLTSSPRNTAIASQG